MVQKGRAIFMVYVDIDAQHVQVVYLYPADNPLGPRIR